MNAEQLATEVLKAAKELLTLEIVTTVSDLDVTVDPKTKKVTFTNQKPTASAVTRIDLAQGDIWTNRSPTTIVGDDSALADYHEKMVEKAEAIIARNFGVLLDVIQKLKS